MSCWAKNAIGSQKEPCTFEIVAAGLPDALQNCSLSIESPNSMLVECIEGFDGGLSQEFLLELFEVPSGHLVRNVSLLVSGSTQRIDYRYGH